MHIERKDNMLLIVAEEDHILVGKPRYFPTPTTTTWWAENIRDPEDNETIEKTENMLKDMFVEVPDGDYGDILVKALQDALYYLPTDMIGDVE